MLCLHCIFLSLAFQLSHRNNEERHTHTKQSDYHMPLGLLPPKCNRAYYCTKCVCVCVCGCLLSKREIKGFIENFSVHPLWHCMSVVFFALFLVELIHLLEVETRRQKWSVWTILVRVVRFVLGEGSDVSFYCANITLRSFVGRCGAPVLCCAFKARYTWPLDMPCMQRKALLQTLIDTSPLLT